MSDDLIYTEPRETPVVTRDGAGTDHDMFAGSGDDQELFLDSLEGLTRQIIKHECRDRDRRVHELELKLAECVGAIGVLRRGGSMTVRGVHSASSSYAQNDVVMVGGSSFVAIRDNTGSPCPGEDWKLLASAGRRGERGPTGPKGERGEPGETTAVPGFMAIHLDRKDYAILLSTTDGKIHTLNLRPLFQQFLLDMRK